MIALVLIAVILAPLAIAEPEGGPRGSRRGGGFGGPGAGGPGAGGPQGRMQHSGAPSQGGLGQMLLGRVAEKLELTEDQKTEIKAIVEGNKENIKKSHEAIRDAMQKLNEAAEKGVEAEIIAAGKAVGDAHTERALQQANIAKQIKEVLTDEQEAKLKELKAEMKERMQQRREGREEGKQGNRPPRKPRGQGKGGRGPKPPVDDEDN